MSNTFTAHQAAIVAAKLCGLDLKLAATISRDVEAEFVPGKGSTSTVNVRVPGATVINKRGIGDTSTPIVHGDIAEQLIPVTLSDHSYTSVGLSEEELSLELVDFGSQVLAPQTTSLARSIEADVAAEMKAVPETTSIAYVATAPEKSFTALRRKLRDNGVSDSERLIAAVGSGVYADLLDANALDENGRVRGFDVIESTRLTASEIVAYIPSAFSLVVRAPRVPEGVPFGASVTEQAGDARFALRWIRQFDPNVLVERSIVSAFVGVQAMPLAVVNESTGAVNLVPHGGAVRVDTAA